MTATHCPACDLIDLTALSAARARTRPTTPTALGRRLVGTRYRTTPTVAMIGQAFAEAVKQPDGRLIISGVPPREAQLTTVAVQDRRASADPRGTGGALAGHTTPARLHRRADRRSRRPGALHRPMHIVSMADIERRAREGRMPPPPAWMRRRIGG